MRAGARLADWAATVIFWSVALSVMAFLGFMLWYVLYHGVKWVDWDFLTKPPQIIRGGGGIGPQLFNSFYLLVLSMAFTAPLGLLGGIYLAEYARPGKISEAIRLAVETLSSLPSIVVGLFGLLVFVSFTGWGYSLMAGALALTTINLPLVVRVSEQAVRGVPGSLREASLALGANRWQTVLKVMLPAAFPSLVSGLIIACGRVFGEAAALLFTAGMSSPGLDFSNWNPLDPSSPLNPFRPAETLAVHIWKVNTEGLIPDLRRVADGSAAVLVMVVVGFNVLARWAARIVHRRMAGA